jgi:flavin-binding protein dodecin
VSVYKMTDIIGTSPVSCEQAATEAVGRARASVDDIRVAQVMEQDMSIDAAGKITFRIKLGGLLQDEAAAPRHSRALILTRRGSCLRAA